MRLKDYAKGRGSRTDTYSLPPSMIQIDPDFNPRDPSSPEVIAHVRSIADSILANGYDQSEVIVIRWTGERALVRDGHCRMAAVVLSSSAEYRRDFPERPGITRFHDVDLLPVRQMPDATDETDDAYKVLTSQTKLPLTPAEWAIQLKKLIAQGQTASMIAVRIGKPRDFVDRVLELASAPIEVRQAVAEHKISPTLAINTMRTNGSETGAVVIRDAIEAGGGKARPRHVAAVTTRAGPRAEPPSLCSFAVATVLAWEGGDSAELDAALSALADKIGEATLDAARRKAVVVIRD